MGLFSKKAPCPICGGKISMFLPTKIEGECICDDCSVKIDMQEEVKSRLTLQELREYLAFYAENQQLKQRFVISQKLDFGAFDTKLIFDFENKLFCFSKQPNKTVFEGAHIKSFTIKEDSAPLFEGSAKGFMRYTSAVPERVNALLPQIQMMLATQRMADNMERMNKDDDNRSTYRPRLDIPEPFQQFYVELHLDHPYWHTIKCDMSAPTFSNEYPDANDYMREYQDHVEVMEQLARAFMEVAFPEAGEQILGASATGFSAVQMSAPPADAIEEIRKCKALMEDGIISKEEFDAKKKQLLGI